MEVRARAAWLPSLTLVVNRSLLSSLLLFVFSFIFNLIVNLLTLYRCSFIINLLKSL